MEATNLGDLMLDRLEKRGLVKNLEELRGNNAELVAALEAVMNGKIKSVFDRDGHWVAINYNAISAAEDSLAKAREGA